MHVRPCIYVVKQAYVDRTRVKVKLDGSFNRGYARVLQKCKIKRSVNGAHLPPVDVSKVIRDRPVS